MDPVLRHGHRMPDFLGIGVSRCGTTWLHDLLSTHPDVYMPTARKELAYFDRHHDRGEAWYAGFFPPEAQAQDYVRVGEITPRYADDDAILSRVAAYGGAERYILMVRDPAKRLVSAFHWERRNRNIPDDFEAYTQTNHMAVARGRFGQMVARICAHIPREALLVLVLEEVSADPDAHVARIAAHLGLDPARFPQGAGHERVNPNTLPRNGWIYARVQDLRRWLIARDLDRLVKLAQKLGLRKMLLSKKTVKSEIDAAVLNRLREQLYAEDITRFETFMGRPIPAWHP